MKIVINRCFGGFGLSERAYERLIELGASRVPYISTHHTYGQERVVVDYEHPECVWDESHRTAERQRSLVRLCGRYSSEWFRKHREDDLLVRVVEELGDAANGSFAKLKVVDVPDGIEWEIDEYDGQERVAEAHRSWS